MPQKRHSRLPLESVARRLGYAGSPTWLPVSRPLTIWALAFVFIDVVVLQAYKELMGYPATFLVNPAWLISPLFVVLAAVGTGYLYDKYDRTLDLIDVESRTSKPEQFSTLAPPKVRLTLYAVGFAYAAFNVYNIGIGLMLETGGLSEVVGTVLVFPFGYVPVFVEFLTVYAGIMIVLPRKIKRTDFRVHFLDPEGLGGLRPVGELIKLTYYLIVVGLVGFLVFTYGPFTLGKVVQTPYPKPGIVVNAAFTGVWILSVGMLAHGLFVLHRFLKREKEEELARLDRQVREVVDSPFDVTGWQVTDEERFEDLRERMRHVNRTREYPTTFAMWSQILLGLILPKAIQLLMAM